MRSEEEVMAEVRRDRLENAALGQVVWLRRIFWLMLIMWVIVPVLAGLMWAFLL